MTALSRPFSRLSRTSRSHDLFLACFGLRDSDGLLSSHPIQVPIHHAEEVEQVFDAISYCKGGSVVRMIKAVLGMADFQKGLSNYMKKYAYGNTETLDLWQSWEEVSGMPISELMASWTEQMGFPLLKVVKEDWQDDKVVLELEQIWFLADGSTVPEEKLWGKPLNGRSALLGITFLNIHSTLLSQLFRSSQRLQLRRRRI